MALSISLVNQTSTELAVGEQILWQSYDAVDCPILIVRGEQSDLLTSHTAGEMVQLNPRARLHTVAAIGHAPTFMVPEQIEPVMHAQIPHVLNYRGRAYLPKSER